MLPGEKVSRETNGARGAVQARRGHYPFQAERGGRGEDRGRGLRPCGFQTERERKERGVGLGKEELTGGPGLSAGRERGRERGAAGPRPRKERARAGRVLGREAEMERKGEKEIPFPFLFLKQIFNAFPKWIFNQFDFQNTHHIKECPSMNAT